MPQPVPVLEPYTKSNGETWWTDPVKGSLFNPGQAERLVAEGHYRFPAPAAAPLSLPTIPGWVKLAGVALLAWWLLGDDDE
jgi:hypothetical protein